MLRIISYFFASCFVYVVGFCMGCSWIFKRNFQFLKSQCRRGDKFWRMFGVLNHWMELKEDDKEIVMYFKKKNYNNIAIYGIGHLGKHLVKELKNTDIKIDYIIDKKVEKFVDQILFKPSDSLPKTDVIVVTAVIEFDEIADEIEQKVDCPIVSLEDVIYEI